MAVAVYMCAAERSYERVILRLCLLVSQTPLGVPKAQLEHVTVQLPNAPALQGLLG